MTKVKGLSPTQRTLKALRNRGLKCAIVEKFNHYAGRFGRREDLFGIIDIIALGTEGVIGVQSCGASFSQHYKKMTEEHAQDTIDWLETPGTSLELWAWRRVKLRRGSKAVRWRPRVAVFYIGEDGAPYAEEKK